VFLAKQNYDKKSDSNEFIALYSMKKEAVSLLVNLIFGFMKRTAIV